jgi:hypothetical protein
VRNTKKVAHARFNNLSVWNCVLSFLTNRIIFSSNSLSLARTVVVYQMSQSADSDEKECPICHEAVLRDPAETHCCRRTFHTPCLCEWLGIVQTCPLCRAQLPAPTAVIDLTEGSGSEVLRWAGPPPPPPVLQGRTATVTAAFGQDTAPNAGRGPRLGRTPRFWAVVRGHQVGVFDNPGQVHDSVHGFPNSSHRSFRSRAAAIEYLIRHLPAHRLPVE